MQAAQAQAIIDELLLRHALAMALSGTASVAARALLVTGGASAGCLASFDALVSTLPAAASAQAQQVAAG